MIKQAVKPSVDDLRSMIERLDHSINNDHGDHNLNVECKQLCEWVLSLAEPIQVAHQIAEKRMMRSGEGAGVQWYD